jgi:hypothetical protein
MVEWLSFSLPQSLCRLYRSKVGFIRSFGGGAGLAGRPLPFTIVDSPVP